MESAHGEALFLAAFVAIAVIAICTVFITISLRGASGRLGRGSAAYG